uniref:Peptidoglycan binding-like domain-containing protein n=1 Tax=Magnetococcus massalia (strain MO-1) TaxID=451514 RepID=A0A1S7LEG5_MAGMO|nr:Conserved protein of unknown function. Containing tetratricopeptide TPR_2 repeat domain. Periplasmic protein TonB, links inner and outer membranes [Candidatus Magnetococcus massalia]
MSHTTPRLFAALILLCATLPLLSPHAAWGQQTTEAGPSKPLWEAWLAPTMANMERLELALSRGDTVEASTNIAELEAHYNQHLPELPESMLVYPLLRTARMALYHNALAEASRILDRIDTILRQHVGSEHPLQITANTLRAVLWIRQERPRDALKMLAKNLQLQEMLLNAEHPALVPQLNMLGDLQIHLQLYDEAIHTLKRAITIVMQARGPFQQARISLHNRLASLYMQTGSQRQAALLLGISLSMEEVLHGAQHPALIFPLRKLAFALSSTGRFDDAKKLLQRALVLAQKSYGTNHLQSVKLIVALADLAVENQDLLESGRLYQKALDIYHALERTQQPRYAHLQIKRATIYQAEAAWFQAERLHREALQLLARTAVTSHKERDLLAQHLEGYRHIVRILNRRAWLGGNMPQKRKQALFTLQQRLKALGYEPGKVDGEPGPQSAQALASYRLKMGFAHPRPMRWNLKSLHLALEQVPPQPPPPLESPNQEKSEEEQTETEPEAAMEPVTEEPAQQTEPTTTPASSAVSATAAHKSEPAPPPPSQ